jgi:hypothetical protein
MKRLTILITLIVFSLTLETQAQAPINKFKISLRKNKPNRNRAKDFKCHTYQREMTNLYPITFLSDGNNKSKKARKKYNFKK